MGLAIVGVTSLAGSVGHWRKGNVRPQVALTFGAVAMAGAFAGAKLAVYLSGAAQLILFAGVMLVAAVLMDLNGRKASKARPEDREVARHRAKLPIIALAAIGVGALTGIAGVGGGVLIVPALVLLVGLNMREAAGTSLLVIAMNSLVGFAGYLGQVEVPWTFLALFTAVAVGGITVGTWAADVRQREPVRTLLIQRDRFVAERRTGREAAQNSRYQKQAKVLRHGADLRLRCITTPITKDPIRFTTSVPVGNPCGPGRVAQAANRKRPPLSIAPPRHIEKKQISIRNDATVPTHGAALQWRGCCSPLLGVDSPDSGFPEIS